jgi:RecJ-like exonuclease
MGIVTINKLLKKKELTEDWLRTHPDDHPSRKYINEALNLVNKRIEMFKRTYDLKEVQLCGTCKGEGRINNCTCTLCEGSGRVTVRKETTVTITPKTTGK